MRQIKFRGKSIGTGEWLFGNLFKFGIQPPTNVPCICPCVPTWKDAVDIYNVHENTVGQFTGLLDKNGKEIYEGDIILLGKNKTYTAQIVYRNDSLRIYSVGGYFIGDLDYIRQCGIEYCEVIGNIHDNPEMVDEIKEKV